MNAVKSLKATAIALIAAAFSAGAVQAQEFPAQPVRIVVGTGPGGSFDRIGRTMAEHLAAELGQPVLIENRPGAATHVGHVYFLGQPADGYTLMVTAPNVVAQNRLTGVADYGPDDFAYINLQWSDYDLVFAGAGRSITGLTDLLDQIAARPGALSAAVISNSSGHQTLLLMLERLGLTEDALRIVTYDDGNELRTALAGGQMDFAITAGDSTLAIRDMITPLAVVRRSAHPSWEVPTLNEALADRGIDVPVIDGTLRSFAVHASLPAEHPERWARLVAAFEAILTDPARAGAIAATGIGTDWLGPERTREIALEAFANAEDFAYLLQ